MDEIMNGSIDELRSHLGITYNNLKQVNMLLSINDGRGKNLQEAISILRKTIATEDSVNRSLDGVNDLIRFSSNW